MANTRAKLGKDMHGAILQVGSYDTANAQNITTTTPLFEYDTVVRVKSYGGDNWVTRMTLENNVVGVVAFKGTNSIFDGQLLFLSGVDTWSDGANTVSVNGTEWQVGNQGIIEITAPYKGETNPPETGWKVVASALSATSAPTSVDYSAYEDVAVADTGMLLETSEEVTMLVYKNDAIATTGGTLNITPVAK